MLITDDSNGKSDGKERDQLQAMVAVGSEFITYQDDTSRVQKSGEFVRIEKDSGESAARFLLLHETSQTYTQDGRDLTGNELRSLAPNVKLRKRSRLYVSEIDPTNGDLPFRELGGFNTQTRISRHHGGTQNQFTRSHWALCEANYTAQAGKRRLFAKGDGKVWLVREVNIPGDTRYFNDALRAIDTTTGQPTNKARGLRAAHVELVEINTTTGAPGKPFFSFDVHSGLGFATTGQNFADVIVLGSATMYDSLHLYAAFSGVLFGSSLTISDSSAVPTGGDASDTYAVAEPAVAKSGAGEYTPIIAVYPSDDDVYDSQSAGPYRLTCKRTTPKGDVVTSKIEFPPIPGLPQHYLAVRGLSLHRTSPDTVVLRVHVHAMQFGAGGSVPPSTSGTLFFWTQDNGASWTYAPVSYDFPAVPPYGGLLTKDKDTLLAFSWLWVGATNTVDVHSVTVTGTQKIASIPASLFNAGLMAPLSPSSSGYFVSYIPTGFGGAVSKKSAGGKKTKRLWMQFDPNWAYKQGEVHVLDYPGSRPMLLVSDDGGLTWARRFLPTTWAFRAGFVVAVSETALAVPVYAPREDHGKPIGITIYLSKDGGDTWGSASAGPTLPGDTWVDGNIVMNAQYPNGYTTTALEQDFVDAADIYNRGELLPLLALRDGDGRALATNPSRPWMTDHKFKEPTYG